MKYPNRQSDEHMYPGPEPFPTSGVGVQQLVTSDFLVTGWALVETTGAAAAVVDIIDGGQAVGTLIARVNLAAGQTVRDTTGPLGVLARVGIAISVVSGSVSGVIWGVNL